MKGWIEVIKGTSFISQALKRRYGILKVFMNHYFEVLSEMPKWLTTQPVILIFAFLILPSIWSYTFYCLYCSSGSILYAIVIKFNRINVVLDSLTSSIKQRTNRL